MEAQLIPINNRQRPENSTTIIEKEPVVKARPNRSKHKRKPFIEANTNEVSLSHLKTDCIIPVFSKDNEKTIAHTEFIEIAQHCAGKVFPHHQLNAQRYEFHTKLKAGFLLLFISL